MHLQTTQMTTLCPQDDAELIVLDAADTDQVSGALLPFAIPAAVKAGMWLAGGATAGAGVGFGIGYWANRD